MVKADLNISVSIALAALFFFCLHVTEVEGSIRSFECVDTIEDQLEYGWGLGDFSYVNKSDDLPSAELKGRLNGTGIFYLDGPYALTGLYKSAPIVKYIPAHMYIKYSIYLTSPDNPPFKIFAGPSLKEELTGFYEYLNNTENFMWTEHLFPLHTDFISGQLGQPGFGVTSLWQWDYVLVDKIILVYGTPDNGIDDVRNLC